MSVLSQLQPKAVFKYFEEICEIPHGSGDTHAIAEYCTGFADAHGLKWYRDDADNVIIYKPASAGYENAEKIILQGHIDMVCEKAAGVDFDFKKDGIVPVIDGDYIRAKGTTLGGDNGIAVAMMLAVLDDESLAHPALEVLLTADEEIGMVGAFALDCSKLSAHRLLNLDSEAEGVLMCSCAGGLDADSVVPVSREEKKLTLVTIDIGGLTSGHSGVEIDKGRANSNVLMARLLRHLAADFDYRLHELEGGTRKTAIAAVGKAVIAVDGADAEAICKEVCAYKEVLSKEYLTTEPAMVIEAAISKAEKIQVLTKESTELVVAVLASLPDSVQAMSVDMPGLVQTSTNLGVMKLEDEAMTFTNTIRSSMTSQKLMVFDKIAAIVSLAGGKTEQNGDYPGWAYNPNSKLKDTIVSAYEKITGKKPAIEAVHAGIECGLFADSIENLDCVSLGPDMGDVHTPNEYLSISSTGRTFELLKMVLKESL